VPKRERQAAAGRRMTTRRRWHANQPGSAPLTGKSNYP
jgi:hypothetical protein